MIESEDQTPMQRRRRRDSSTPLPMPQVGDRLPPHSIEAEQSVLGAILHDARNAMPLAIEKLRRGGETFYDLRHQALFDVLAEMYDRQELIEATAVQQYLKDRNQLEALGGMPYIAGLMNCAGSVEYYGEIVREKFILRKLIQTCTSAIANVYDHQGEVDGLLDQVESEILEIGQERVTNKSPTIKELVHKSMAMMEAAHLREGALEGLSSGFPDLDKMNGGFKGGEMIVIAGRPSMGKTALAMNIAEHVAVELKEPVGIFSLEMSGVSLTTRAICSNGRVNNRSLRDGFLAERDFGKLTTASGKIANSKLHIDDAAGLSIMQLRAKARRMYQQHGIKLFVIDYLQLLNAKGAKFDNRQQEIAQISNGIKALAKELNVPVIVLAQLNRELEKDKNRKPRLSDLRESGAIEQDADLVGLLYKPEREETEDEPDETDALPVNLLIAKQRNGPTGDVFLTFLKSYTRYESRSKVSDVPHESSNRNPYPD